MFLKNNNITKNKHTYRKNGAGFTSIELLVSIVIIITLAAVVVGGYFVQRKRSDLHGAFQGVVDIVRLAQNKTLASSSNSQYGVHFDASSSPNKYILFKGATYSSGDSSNVSYPLPDTMEFYSISLGGGNDIIFDKLTGSSEQSGNLSLRLKSDTSQNQIIYIASSGAVGFLSPVSPSDSSRIKDSRHVHFDYSKASFVSCPSTDATISLYFDGSGSAQQTISVCNNLVNGELEWLGTVSISGSNQTVEIHTHHLLDAGYANGTQFSIHRDGRLNSKSLKITISGDGSGNLIKYSADGLTVNGVTTSNCSSGASELSSYVSNCNWQ